jgi:hypothetical protein
MYAVNSNQSKKQTTTKKSRYDDSYLSDNNSPSKEPLVINIIDIPEDEEKSGSS